MPKARAATKGSTSKHSRQRTVRPATKATSAVRRKEEGQRQQAHVSADKAEPIGDVWLDTNLRTTIVVANLSATPAGRRALDKAITECAGDGYEISPALHAFFDRSPLGAEVLAKVTKLPPDLDWTSLYGRMIEYWDGEDDPLAVRCWGDLSKLPNLATLRAGQEWPTSSDLRSCPSLRELILTVDISNKRDAAKIEKLCAAAGFAPTTVHGHSLSLAPGTWTPASSHMVRLFYDVPHECTVERARFVDGALVATMSCRMNDQEHEGDVRLLDAVGARTVNAKAVHDVFARVKKFVRSNGALPETA